MKYFLALVIVLALVGPSMTGCSARPLLYDVEFYPEVISPNADGHDDAANILYKLSRNASLSIYFVDQAGERHYHRNEERRSAQDEPYWTLFGGVVDVSDGGPVKRRMMPDGQYTWIIEATDDSGHTEKAEGSLTIVDADTAVPEMRNFSVYPQVFTPNQDGIDDRVAITFYLTKEAESYRVYLEDEEGNRYPIAEKEREVKPGQPGMHIYDYEGGVDLGATPPPDGIYTVVAEAEDLVGNKTVITSTLTFMDGGVPRADIVNADVDFAPMIVPLGGTLTFTATVENFGAVPIRTTGPSPGTTYESDQNFNSLGWYEEPGAWRLGIDFETNSSGRPYPYRFAIGDDDDLEIRVIRGKEYRYLMPGQRATVVGHIHIVNEPPRNPIYFFAGLIHEDVRIDPFNDHVDPQEISIGF